MVQQLLATKREMTQLWTKSGKRFPITMLHVEANVVAGQKEGKVLVGYGEKKLKNTKKPIAGFLKKVHIDRGVRQMIELKGDAEGKNLGEVIKPSEVFSVGDVVTVSGRSKGMGWAGVVKLHGFHGGPRTHGQSDRERAPGASSSGTTPGRLYKGKRMAARGGNNWTTIENLQIVKVDDTANELWVKGLVPGAMNGTVVVTKKGEGVFEAYEAPQAVKAAETPAEEKSEEKKVEEKTE